MLGKAPSYLQNLLVKLPITGHNLRSARRSDLVVPRTKYQTFVARSFSVAGPRYWNSIPESIRSLKTVDNSKVNLRRTYSNVHTSKKLQNIILYLHAFNYCTALLKL
jgi:hypothetical protein